MTSPAATIVIPTRMDSTRFPGKAIASETGRALVLHVADRASQAVTARRIIVAAPDREILRIVADAGFEAMETREDHPNGTSRLAEVVDRLGDAVRPDSIVVNVQGDEPEIDPGAIDAVVEALHGDPEADMATVASRFFDDEDPADPNIVKIVVSEGHRAIYFSRALVPADRDGVGVRRWRHVGLYAYRAEFLRRYAAWPECELERAERLEQLRVLAHGGSIAVARFDQRGGGIDTPEQYAAFVARWSAGTPNAADG